MTDIYINEDNSVKVSDLRDGDNQGLINDATVTYVLKDSGGSTVGTGTLTYTSGSHGEYKAVIDKAVTAGLTEGARYYLEITMASGTRDGFRRIPLTAKYRELV